MNAERRTQIRKARKFLEEAKDILENALNEEDEYRDNMPENLQISDRYEQSEGFSSSLEDAIDEIDSAIESLGEVV